MSQNKSNQYNAWQDEVDLQFMQRVQAEVTQSCALHSHCQ